MKRIGSLWAVLSVVSTLACAGAGDEAWSGQDVGAAAALQEQDQSIQVPSEDAVVIKPADTCVPAEDPAMPTVTPPINLDEWNFTYPLLPVTTTTRSLYLVAFQSPVDRARIYVYGIDVGAQR